MKRYKSLKENKLDSLWPKLKKLAKGEKFEFPLSNVDPKQVQDFTNKIEKIGYNTYVSSGKLLIQKR